MKQKILENWNVILTLVLGVIAFLNIFGFHISKAITQDQYRLDQLKLQQQLEEIRDISHDIYCYSLKTRKMLLQMEQIKYQDYTEIKIEEEMHGALPTYHRAKAALSGITNDLNDVNNLIEREKC